MTYSCDAYYHCFNRGANKADIFFEEENYRYLIFLMEKYSIKYMVVLEAYCLMPNHYHIVARQLEAGSLTAFLKTTFNAFTQAMNTKYNRSGTLFQGQVKVKEVTSDEYCAHLIRYIHLNPVEAGIVCSPELWKHSNYLEWIDKRQSSCMDYDLRKCYFKDGNEYKLFVEEYQDEEQLKKLSKYLFREE